MRRSLLGIAIGIVFLGGVAFASWFGYTNLSFFDGIATGKTLNMDFAVGTSSGFAVIIENPTLDPQSLRLDFVSQIQTTDGLISCDMISGQEYGNNLLWSGEVFVVAPQTIEQKSVNFNFEACTSGVFLGCAVQLAASGTDIGSFDVIPGKVNFMTLRVSPGDACITYKIVARPAFRSEENGYALSGSDFWFLINSGGTWLSLYNSSTAFDPKVTTDIYGYSTIDMIRPAVGTEYMVVFKAKGALAVGYTGIWNNSIREFNFFSGASANAMSDRFVFKAVSDGITGNYLRIGDLVDYTQFTYDMIVDSDFAEVNNNLTLGIPRVPKFWYDFDLNGVVSAMEQSMVLQSYTTYGFISWLDGEAIVPMNLFVSF